MISNNLEENLLSPKEEMINICDLVIDENVADFIEKCLQVEFPKILVHNLQDEGTYSLSMDKYNNVNVNDYMPLSVERGIGGKYILLNGRHRISKIIVEFTKTGNNLSECYVKCKM